MSGYAEPTGKEGDAEPEVIDPKDNVQYPDCSLMIDDFDFTLDGERRGKTSMVVKENRS